MASSTTTRSAKLHAPELSAEHIAEIEAALAATHSDWQPSGAALRHHLHGHLLRVRRLQHRPRKRRYDTGFAANHGQKPSRPTP